MHLCCRFQYIKNCALQLLVDVVLLILLFYLLKFKNFVLLSHTFNLFCRLLIVTNLLSSTSDYRSFFFCSETFLVSIDNLIVFNLQLIPPSSGTLLKISTFQIQFSLIWWLPKFPFVLFRSIFVLNRFFTLEVRTSAYKIKTFPSKYQKKFRLASIFWCSCLYWKYPTPFQVASFFCLVHSIWTKRKAFSTNCRSRFLCCTWKFLATVKLFDFCQSFFFFV